MPDLIVCDSCRRANDPWRQFCGGCGGGLPGGCVQCGMVNHADDKFCGGCSAALAFTSGISASPKPRRKSPSTQTSTIPIDITELLPDIPRRS